MRLLGGTTFTTRTLRFAWHVTAVLWWGFAVLLWQLASAPASTSTVLAVIGWTSIAAGLLPMAITRGLHLSWMVLFAVGGICVYAAAA